jgi:hypothetical protein
VKRNCAIFASTTTWTLDNEYFLYIIRSSGEKHERGERAWCEVLFTSTPWIRCELHLTLCHTFLPIRCLGHLFQDCLRYHACCCFEVFFLVWQLSLSAFLLWMKYRSNHIVGCLLVTVGVVLSVVRYVLEQLALFWLLISVVHHCSLNLHRVLSSYLHSQGLVFPVNNCNWNEFYL